MRWAPLVLACGCLSEPARPTCRQSELEDTFSDADPCGPLGSSWGNATITEAGGVLRIAPDVNDGGCVYPAAAFTEDGIFVEMRKVIDTRVGHTGFSTSGDDLSMVAAGGELVFGETYGRDEFTRIPYDATTMRWWRMRPADDVTLAETSPDGKAWVEIGRSNKRSPGMTHIELSGGLAAAATTGPAEIANLNVCQP